MLERVLFYTGAVAVLAFVACSGGSELVDGTSTSAPGAQERSGELGSLKAALVDGGVVDGGVVDGGADGGESTTDL